MPSKLFQRQSTVHEPIQSQPGYVSELPVNDPAVVNQPQHIADRIVFYREWILEHALMDTDWTYQPVTSGLLIDWLLDCPVWQLERGSYFTRTKQQILKALVAQLAHLQEHVTGADAPKQAAVTVQADRKGHQRTFQGFVLTIEFPKGSTRKGTAPDGTKWEREMVHDYGHFVGIPGADGDSLDCYVGEDLDADHAYVVHQLTKDGELDEHKIMLGFASPQAAMEGYLTHMPRDWSSYEPIVALTLPEFRDWLFRGDPTSKVAGSYTPEDVPQNFWAAIVLDGDTFSDLEFGQINGVQGISASPSILDDFLPSADAFLRMPGAPLERANSVSRVLYHSPEYLLSKDMTILRRICGGSSAANVIGLILGKLGDWGTAEVFGNWLRIQGKVPTINSVEDFERKVTPLAQEFDNADPTGDGKKLRLQPGMARNAVLAFCKSTMETYGHEGEWILKNQTLNVPPGTHVGVLLPGAFRDVAEAMAFYTQKLQAVGGDFAKAHWETVDFPTRELLGRIHQTLAFRDQVRGRYTVGFVTRAAFSEAAASRRSRRETERESGTRPVWQGIYKAVASWLHPKQASPDLAQAVYDIAHSNEAYEALGSFADDFQTGGCWVFAEALHRNLPGSQLVALQSDRNPVEHVVVRYKGDLYDSDGAFTQAQMILKFKREFGIDTRVVPFNGQNTGEVTFDHAVAEKLQQVVRNTLTGIIKGKEAPDGQPERQPGTPNPKDLRRESVGAVPNEPGGADPADDGKPSWAFTRKSGPDVEQVRVLGARVTSVWGLSPATKQHLEAVGVHSPDMHELTSDEEGANAYHSAIMAAKTANPFGAGLTAYAPEDYVGSRMFLAPDGKAGIVLTKDGDRVSAFVHPDGPKGAMATMFRLAASQGGMTGDCFDTVLPDMYSQFGARIVARLAWNDEYAPEGWDYELYKEFNNGRPDVVFTVYDPEYAQLYKAGDGVRVQDWDEGKRVQAEAVQEILARKSHKRSSAPWAGLPAAYTRSLFAALAGEDGPDVGEHGEATDDSGEFWGDQGAGCIFRAEDTGRLLFAHRSEFVNEPHTWGVWGGAIEAHEQPLAAVRREVAEEAGYTGAADYKQLYVFTKGKFRFTTFLATVPKEFIPRLDWETQDYRWVDPGDWPQPLHFGVKSLLPQLEAAVGHAEGKKAGIYDGYCPICGRPGCGGTCHKTARPKDETLLKKIPGTTPEMIAQASRVDDDRYLTWVLQQVAQGHAQLPQDTARLRQALHVFHIASKEEGFTGSKDVNHYTAQQLYQLAQDEVTEDVSTQVVEMLESSASFEEAYDKMKQTLGPQRLQAFLQGVGGLAQVRRRWDMLVGDAHDHANSVEHHRISARKPWAVGVDPESLHKKTKLQPSVAAYTTDEHLDRAVKAFESYPGFGNLKGDTPDKLKQIVKRLSDNLVWLYNQVAPEIRDRSKMWYVGGNRLIHRWAKHYSLEPYKIAGVIAVLSPQRDWFQNVSLAERVLDVVTEHLDDVWTPEMSQAVVEWVQRAEEIKAVEEARKRKNMGEEAYAQLLESRRQRAERKKLKQQDAQTGGEDEEEEDASAMLKMVPLCEGKTLQQVMDNPALAALWVRAWDQTYHSRNYRVATPEGEFGDYARKTNKETQACTWSSLPNIWKALDIIHTTNPKQVSDLVGENHKVRSFYNNLIAPMSKGGDVTIDTHAVAAALIRPLAASHREVHHNFGTSPKGDKGGPMPDAGSGNIGTYAIYADAYRVAAKRLGVLPREVQSITWEAVRTLFKPTQKNDQTLQDGIINTWEGVSRGKSPERARNTIRDLAGGFDDPAWAGSHYQPHDFARHSSYKGELHPHD